MRMSLDSYVQAKLTIRHKPLQADPQSERTSVPRERQCGCKSSTSSDLVVVINIENHLAAAQLPQQPQNSQYTKL